MKRVVQKRVLFAVPSVDTHAGRASTFRHL